MQSASGPRSSAEDEFFCDECIGWGLYADAVFIGRPVGDRSSGKDGSTEGPSEIHLCLDTLFNEEIACIFFQDDFPLRVPLDAGEIAFGLSHGHAFNGKLVFVCAAKYPLDYGTVARSDFEESRREVELFVRVFFERFPERVGVL